jgi:transposase
MLKEILIYKAQLLGKKVVTVDPSYTSQNDFRGILRGERKGCRYYTSDKKVLDADWNAAINIGKRSKLPISFNFPYDGKLNFVGRSLSIDQSYRTYSL